MPKRQPKNVDGSPLARFAQNRTLYGLRTNATVRVHYNPDFGHVEKVEGADQENDDIQIADDTVFGIPAFIAVADVPLFPSAYELGFSGTVIYHALRPPRARIHIETDSLGLNERAKILEYTLDLKKLAEFDRKRVRTPSQRAVMGESAREHAQRLIDLGRVRIDPGTTVTWHWCHLLAFSFLPTHRAQAKRNLICGTAAFNGQMANAEAAIKAYVYEFRRPLGLEVTATYLEGSHLGTRFRYRIHDRKTGESHTEYYDPYTDVLGDFADLKVVFERLVSHLSHGT